MANFVSALKWLRDNLRRHRISVRKMTWPELHRVPIFDYEIELDCDGHSAIGRGIAVAEPSAVVKALAESLERLHCLRFGVQSPGMAAHLDVASAERNARCELFERDALLSCIKGEERPKLQPLTGLSLALTRGMSQLDFWTAEIGCYRDVPVTLVMAFDQELLVSYGLGAGGVATANLEKATLETLPSAAHYLHGGPPRAGDLVGWSKLGGTTPTLATVTSAGVRFTYETCNLLDSPFVAARAQSPDLRSRA